MTKTELILRDMCQPGAASFITGGQWGSEAKGCAAAWLAYEMVKSGRRMYDVVTTNAGAQAGHTSIHRGVKRVSFHLPTFPQIVQHEGGKPPITYLNAGSVIDPAGFLEEVNDSESSVYIHPNAAVITGECVRAERDPGSSQTKIASTQKGVGEAIAQKVKRAALLAKDHPDLKPFIREFDLSSVLAFGDSVLVEVPQGVSLSINSRFYPHTTSRNCTPMQAMSDAGIHPYYYGASLVVLRTYPIRVGNIVATNGEEVGNSGACYPDQRETTWESLGVAAEITTVTKRVRRVFTFSERQILDTFTLCRPDVVFLTFVNYLQSQQQLDEIEHSFYRVSEEIGMPPPRVVYEWGPTTEDIGEEYVVGRSDGRGASGIEVRQ